MINQLLVCVLLFTIIAIVGQVFNKSTLPITLLLVIVGILLSFIPFFPVINLNPEIVLNVFLPLLIYQISSFSSWSETKKNLLPITLLSVGHVIFITILSASVIHLMIPTLSWPLAFVLGAVISPPDDVAIVSIAEKVRMPKKIITILEGEAIFNDATALIIFRFALAATFTMTFSPLRAVSVGFLLLLAECLYGLTLGYLIGELRLKMTNPMMHLILSLLTPFFAIIPIELIGGTGILATAITGFIIGNVYAVKFTPEFRLYSRAVWPVISLLIQSLLFILVGLNLRGIVANVSTIPIAHLLTYAGILLLTLILGRFIWVYGVVAYLPKLFKSKSNKKSKILWQYPFVISWAGMRGGISLAAALAVPALPQTIEGSPVNDVLLFLVVCVIIATFIVQGLSLPFILKKLGLTKKGSHEAYKEHLAELKARYKMTKAVLTWLDNYKAKIRYEPLLDEIDLYMREYKLLRQHLKENIASHTYEDVSHDEVSEVQNETFLASQIIEIEKKTLLKLWQDEKINFYTRNKLLSRLDHKIRHTTG